MNRLPIDRPSNFSFFNDFFSSFDQMSMLLNKDVRHMPSIDLKESDNEFTIYADLPGVDEDDIRVTITEDYVSISGERKEEIESQNENYYQLERSHGSFQRSVSVSGVDTEKASASYKNGVLEIRLPKLDKKENTEKILEIEYEEKENT